MKRRKITQLFCVVAMSLFGMQFAAAQSPNPPNVLPAPPTHDAVDVLSIYSDAYTANPVAAFTFAGSEASEVTISGDRMKYVKIGTGSVAYGSATITFDTPLNIANYNVIFMDIYAVEQNQFNLRIRFDGAQISYAIKTGWNRLEIDMNDYKMLVSPPNFTAISTIEFVGEGARTLYMDNIYAYDGVHSDLANAPATPAPTPVHSLDEYDVIPIFSDAYANEIGGLIDATTVATIKKIKGIQYGSVLDKMIYVSAGKSGTGGFNLNNIVDASNYDFLHFDVYPIGSTFPMRIMVGGVSTEKNKSILTASKINEWNSMDISIVDLNTSMSVFSIPPDYSSLKNSAFWIYQSGGYERSFFLDNIYFYKEAEDPGPGTNLKETSLATSVSVYPNPVIDKVSVNSEIAVNSIGVSNFAGQIIKTVQGNEVDMSGVANGVYLLKISLEDGSVVTKKIIK